MTDGAEPASHFVTFWLPLAEALGFEDGYEWAVSRTFHVYDVDKDDRAPDGVVDRDGLEVHIRAPTVQAVAARIV